MDFKDLLRLSGFDPDARERIALVRHRPFEPKLAGAMPWLITERPDLFETYQSVPGRPEATFRKANLIASFLGMRPGTAHFVGLYRAGASRPLDRATFWSIAENMALKDLGYEGFTADQQSRNGTLHQFKLQLLPFYLEWRGRLVSDVPPPERVWVRWVDRGAFPIRAIVEDSAFTSAPPEWHEIDLTFAQVALLPQSWRARLSEWRGIYLIFDERDGKSYVGSAYGATNILGRWQAYAQDGHGGNRELIGRDPSTFRFTILERVAPELPPADVIAKENSWKLRLHTRVPFGLNAN